MTRSAEVTKYLIYDRAEKSDDASMIKRERSSRAVAMTIALTATILLVMFSTFEAAKDLLIDDITLCQSHVITIWFTTALGTFSALLVFRHSRRLNEQILSEMSQRTMAEKALNANARFIARVTNTVPAMISYIDTDLRYRFVNRQYENLYHLPVDKIVGAAISELDGDKFLRVRAKLEEALRGHEVTHEFSFTEDNCTERHLRASYIPDFDDDGEICGLFIQNMDITELKNVEATLMAKQEQLTSLAMELALVEERERRNIAGELHDHVGQALVLCKIKLGSLSSALQDKAQIEHLDAVTALLEGAIQDVRSVSMQLSPPLLTTVGLEAALEWLAEQIKADYGIQVECWGDGQPKPLREELRTVIFQTVRELLINVAKHAKAHHVRIIVSGQDSRITVVVEDDGIGFDISKQSLHKGRSGGFGLFNIRQKIEYLGGELLVESTPGCGTRTTITAPMQLETERRSIVNGGY